VEQARSVGGFRVFPYTLIWSPMILGRRPRLPCHLENMCCGSERLPSNKSDQFSSQHRIETASTLAPHLGRTGENVVLSPLAKP
jgi:hypothetical protein